MSNPQAQGSQGPGQQPQQGPQMLKAEDIVRLQCLNADQKQKYKPVMENFWNMYNSKPQGSPEWQQARAKLQEWSQKLINQERQFRMRNRPNAAAQGTAAGTTNSQSQPDSNSSNTQLSPPAPTPTPAAPPASEPSLQINATPPAPAPVPKQEPTTQPGMTQPASQGQRPPGQAGGMAHAENEIMKHVMNFPMHLPPDQPQAGTPEGDTKIKELRNTYAMIMRKLHHAGHKLKVLTSMTAQLQSKGQPVSPEMTAQKQQAETEHQAAKKYVDDFRQKQGHYKAEHERRKQSLGAQQSQPQSQQQQPQQPQQQQPPQQSQAPPPSQVPPQQARPQPQTQNLPQQNAQNIVKQEPQIKVEGGQQPFNNNIGHPAQQQQQQQQQQPQQQQPQQVTGPSAQQQPRPPPQLAHPNQSQFGQGVQQQPQAPRPQINPHIANTHAQQQQQHNSPHPQSATSAGPPVPLTHQAAVSAAQRSYSQTDQRTGTPMQHSQGNFPAPGSREREQLNNPKLPIPRQLNTTAPTPVSIGPARPTMSGPTNGAPGPMGQPVINKFPPFQLEGEGDRVLSKRKLDELVRQVTGGAEDALTPEVEETMLMLADEFVDNVIGSSCKLAKLRESPQLEIRDIQLVLERNYNIRIPGFASDEVRTVRKIVPAQGWQLKMNAVQAAKVMNGGKNDV